MPVVSSLDHLPTDGEFYSNNCVDGHCIGSVSYTHLRAHET